MQLFLLSCELAFYKEVSDFQSLLVLKFTLDISIRIQFFFALVDSFLRFGNSKGIAEQTY